MITNDFIWADLSSYEPLDIKPFYEAVFGWKYYENAGYWTSYSGTVATSGLYKTPQKFQEMSMPSFWMSYIQVESINETVAKARELGGIIELVEVNNPLGGVALIRDTLGAGFTVYEGNALSARTQNKPNTLIFNELQVSDAKKAISFYTALFDWRCKASNVSSYEVYNANDQHIADINEVPNRMKGNYEYWACIFGVMDIRQTTKEIQLHGGEIISDEGHRALCSDGSEAFFYIQEL